MKDAEGFYTHLRNGTPLCPTHRTTGTCSSGFWCTTNVGTVHVCKRCLDARHSHSAGCPYSDVPETRLDRKGKGKGKSGPREPKKDDEGDIIKPSAKYPCRVCKSEEHWARECPDFKGERKSSYLKKTSQYKNLTKKEVYMIDQLLLDDYDGVTDEVDPSRPEGGTEDQE